MPFFGLLLAAACGIVASKWSGVSPVVFLAVAGVFLAAWAATKRSIWVYASVAAAFACAYCWQTSGSAAWALAKKIGQSKILCSATGFAVSDPTPYGANRERFLLAARALEIDGREYACPVKFAVALPSPAPGRGDSVRVTGALTVIPPPRNPAAFDARTWMALQGVTSEIAVNSPADVVVLSSARWYSLPSLASRSCAWMEETLREGIGGDPVIGDLLCGMVLGVTASIPDELQQEFRNTGTFHLFSVSGLHVGMIAFILWQFLKLVGVRRRWSVAVIIPALFFYALITGWKPSSLRAAVMSSIFLIGITSSRQPVPLNSLCAAGFLILVQSARELFNPGFQLSFLVVAAILVLALPIHDAIRRRVHPDAFLPRRIWNWRERAGAESAEKLGGLFAVSLAAWVGSFPLTLYYFHVISFSALPANLAIVPLAFLIMVTACFALAGGIFSTFLAEVFNNANWVFTKALLFVVQAAAALPFSHCYVGLPENAPAAVTVFDFGAGGAAAVETQNKIWFVDCGPAHSLESVLVPWLRGRGREAPDGIVLTHGDARHIGSAAGLAEKYPRPAIVDSSLEDKSPVRGGLHRKLENLGIPKSICRAGDRIPIGKEASFSILYPPAALAGKEADDKVIIARLNVGPAAVLFLSDAGPTAQAWLLENCPQDLASDILVVGRHRSGLPVEGSFLDAVRPRAIVATSDDFPKNEAIDSAWAEMVEARGIKLLCQDATGAARIEIRGKAIRLTGFADGSEIRLE